MAEESKTLPSDPPLLAGEYHSLESDAVSGGPIKSVEGWIVFVAGIHEEAEEDIIVETFGRFGQIRNLHLNLDRRTGYLKGYALLEFETMREAEAAIAGMNGKTLLGQTVHCDFAYRKPGRIRRCIRQIIVSMEGYSFLGKGSPRAHSIKVFITGVGYKIVTFEEDWSVQELCASVARKLRLTDEHLFGIFEVYGEPGVGKERCIKDNDTLRQKLGMSILPGRQFVFKYKYLIDMKIARAEDRAMEMYYLQTKESILSGYYHTPASVAVDLAAIQMQVEFGLYDSRTHHAGFLLPRIRDFVPVAILSDANAKEVEAGVIRAYSEIPERQKSDLKRAYLAKAMTLSVFGCRFFEARQNKIRDFPKRFYLGVKSTGLVAVNVQERTYIQDWTFEVISRWGNKTDETTGQETLYIQMQSKGNRSKGVLWVLYTDAEAVCELLDKYSMEMFKTLSEEGRVQLTMTEEKAAQTILAYYRGYRVRKRLYEVFVYLNETGKLET